MLRVIATLAEQPYVIAACKTAGIAPATWRAIITNDALDADQDGRNMRTSQTVAAARVQRGEKQVQRARSIAVRIGIMAETFRGRELTRDERMTLVREHPGHKQRGLPSVYAFTLWSPRQRARVTTPKAGENAAVVPQDQTNVHLPPVGGLSLHSYVLDILTLTAADAAEGRKPPRRRRSRAGLGLAVAVLEHPRMAHLLPQVRPGTLAGMLAPYSGGGWNGHDLADALLTEASRRMIPTWSPARSPWGLFKTLLSGIDALADVHNGTGTAYTDPTPCADPACDHGWITLTADDGHMYARPCPTCPPSSRRHDPVPSDPLPF